MKHFLVAFLTILFTAGCQAFQDEAPQDRKETISVSSSAMSSSELLPLVESKKN